MKVTIRDRGAEGGWGSGPITPCVRTVEIANNCPQCGVKRGEPRGLNESEDGTFYWVQIWTNPCGHIDFYVDVVREAAELLAAAEETGTEAAL